MGGVHNKKYNLDLYNDGSLEVYNHKKEKLITTFDKETFDLLLAMIKNDLQWDDKDGCYKQKIPEHLL